MIDYTEIQKDRVRVATREIIQWIVIGFFIVCGIGVVGYFSLRAKEIDAKINAQTEVEKTEIQQKAAIQRTRERMHWIPWYSDQKNEADAAVSEAPAQGPTE